MTQSETHVTLAGAPSPDGAPAAPEPAAVPVGAAPARGELASGQHPQGPVIVTQGLTKRFGHRGGGQLAVAGLDLAVPARSVFGFLGPNGSGKTTTIRMLLGLVAPTSGHASLLGQPMPSAGREVLPRVGALIEGPALYPFLSGERNLERYDSADPCADPSTRARRVAAALDRVGLTAARRKRAGAYSLGMKQRLGIAAALLQPRELLVLDEPTNGLDPQGTREIRTLVRELADEGTTVFLSTHLLAEVEQICTHAAVMSRGRLVTQGTVAELRTAGQTRLVVQTPDATEAARVLAGFGLPEPTVRGDQVEVALPSEVAPPSRADGEAVAAGMAEADTPSGGPVLEELAAALVRADVRLRGFTVHRGSLEDAFVALTGEGFDVAG
jgi:ABC-2 type transport system ATP-binding protein